MTRRRLGAASRILAQTTNFRTATVDTIITQRLIPPPIFIAGPIPCRFPTPPLLRTSLAVDHSPSAHSSPAHGQSDPRSSTPLKLRLNPFQTCNTALRVQPSNRRAKSVFAHEEPLRISIRDSPVRLPHGPAQPCCGPFERAMPSALCESTARRAAIGATRKDCVVDTGAFPGRSAGISLRAA